MSKTEHLESGVWAENQACTYLRKKGLRLVTKNYHSRFGELDLIMEHNDYLVFVEVRFRKSISFGDPATTIDFRKQSKLRKTATEYLVTTKGNTNINCRFDVITISGDKSNTETTWLQNAF